MIKTKNKKGQNVAPRTKNSGHKNIVLNSNCSECVFRLTGSFEDIKKEMFNILEWTRKEYCGEVGDSEVEDGVKKPQPLHPNIAKSIAEVKQKIEDAKTLEDFEKIVIEFTCNYETFFKEDENGDGLLVATCNNYTYDDVKKKDVYDEDLDYYKVAGKTSYVLKNKIDGHYVFELEYKDEDHKDYPMYIYADKGQIFYEENYEDKTIEIKKGKSIRFVTRGNIAYKMENNHLVKVEEIKDKVLLNKIKILANLEG